MSGFLGRWWIVLTICFPPIFPIGSAISPIGFIVTENLLPVYRPDGPLAHRFDYIAHFNLPSCEIVLL